MGKKEKDTKLDKENHGKTRNQRQAVQKESNLEKIRKGRVQEKNHGKIRKRQEHGQKESW